jgi:hypothetical protein
MDQMNAIALGIVQQFAYIRHITYSLSCQKTLDL